MPNRLETWRVEAYNTAKQSENKMHDDTVARRFGFSGGLVPGVDVFAYMMHVPVARWAAISCPAGWSRPASSSRSMTARPPMSMRPSTTAC